MAEFWEDKVEGARKVMDGFTVPLLRKALEEREIKKGSENKEGETLLSHLVQHTQGPPGLILCLS